MIFSGSPGPRKLAKEGRHHEISRSAEGGTVEYDMSEYAKSAVEMYSKLTGVEKFRPAATPFLPDGSFRRTLAINEQNRERLNKIN